MEKDSLIDRTFGELKTLKTTNAQNLQKRLELLECLLTECLNSQGLEKKGSESRIISRSLKSIFYNICDIEMKYVYAVKNSPKFFPVFKSVLNSILDKLKHYKISSNSLVDRVRTMDYLEMRIHEMYYAMINHRLKLILSCLRDDSDLIEWKPPAAEFVDTFTLEMKTITDYDVVMICKRELIENENLVFDLDYLALRKYMMEAKTVQPIGNLNWSLVNQKDRSVCPTSYIIQACSTVDLLEVSERFQLRVAGMKRIDSDKIVFIFLMCCAILDRSRSFTHMKYDQICAIFNVVFSVLNFILPDVYKHFTGGYLMKIMKDCSNIYYFSRKLSHKFSEIQVFKDYVDILFKYVVVLRSVFLHYHSGRYYFFIPQKTVALVTRKFMPNKIGNRYDNLNSRFKELPQLKDLLDQLKVKPLCSICGYKFDDTNMGEMAILERCNHIYCTKCLMRKINILTKLKEFFVCPQSDCKTKHAGFILGKDYEKIKEIIKPENED